MKQTLIVLYVADQERAKDFYGTTLDTVPALHVPGMTEFPLPGGAALGLMPEDGIKRLLGEKIPHPSHAKGVPRCELYLRLPDAQKTIARALDAGATLISPLTPRNWGEQVAYLYDPDRHILAIAQQ